MANLEDLKKRLYKEKETFEERMVPPELVRPRRGERPAWEEETVPQTRRFAFLDNIWVKRIFWGAFAVALVAAAFWFFVPSFFKTNPVEIEIVSSKEIKSGDRVTWQVKVNNKNSQNVNDAVLVFNFPQNSSPVTGPKPSGTFRERRSLGVIKAGESVSENFDAYVFGAKDSTGEVSAAVEYRPEGATSIFASDSSFDFTIAQSPVTVSFKMPDQLRIGQTVDIEIDYVSQASESITDLSLKTSFPDGFEYVSASPAPSGEQNNLWSIGTLDAGASGAIKLRGVIKGSASEPKTFKADLGIWDRQNKSLLSYGGAVQTAVLSEPFLGLSMKANGQDSYIAFPGDSVEVVLNWKNNLNTEVKDAVLELKLAGDAVDFRSIRAENGVFQETAGSVVWNASSYDAFKSLAVGEAGEAKFSFKVKSSYPLDSASKRPLITMNASLKSGGEVPGYEGVDVTGLADYSIKVSSRLQITSRALYFNSAIPNTGPLPPKVSKETTYTIVWSLANMVNDLNNVIVTSSVQPYMSFKNIISPPDIDISYDKNSGEITWRVGRITAGTGFLRPAMQIAFQVSIVPSQNQIDTAPILINETSASGDDAFTGAHISAKDSAITTDLPDDPNIGFNQKKVAP